ncbi:MAG: hypothetical protein KY432_00805 [Acidobacteria bacterium]|nr:hypothetical protein [Acidobacteriota bacterium]
MTEGFKAGALDEKLRHELNNAMMAVLSFAQVIDRHAGDNPAVHDAVEKITTAVNHSRSTVNQVSDELAAIASRLSSRSR